LIDAAQAGDQRALFALLERHQAQIYRFGLKLCRNPEDAQEVLQETMLTVAKSLPGFRGQSSLSTWLYTIARSFCAKQRRRSKFAPDHELSLEDPGSSGDNIEDPKQVSPDEALADKRLEHALAAAIAALDPMYREVLVLRDMEGLPASEVAEVLGLSVDAVKSRLHRARKAVREQLLASGHVTREVSGPVRGDDVSGCPDIVAMWSSHQEDDISPEACAKMERHLAQCPRCQSECDSLKRTLALCRTSSAGATVPEHVQQAVRLAVRDFLKAGPTA
jgi:RNA polymerase sigma-70 factor (ECF subfamily)